MVQLREEVVRLEAQHQQLSEELNGPQLSLPQQKEMLLQKVKADNAEIAEMEKRLAEMQDADAAEAQDPGREAERAAEEEAAREGKRREAAAAAGRARRQGRAPRRRPAGQDVAYVCRVFFYFVASRRRDRDTSFPK